MESRVHKILPLANVVFKPTQKFKNGKCALKYIYWNCLSNEIWPKTSIAYILRGQRRRRQQQQRHRQ